MIRIAVALSTHDMRTLVVLWVYRSPVQFSHRRDLGGHSSHSRFCFDAMLIISFDAFFCYCGQARGAVVAGLGGGAFIRERPTTTFLLFL